MKAETILVLDDDLEILNSLERTLIAEGYQVIIAIDQHIGLKKALQCNPDLIIVEENTPRINGLQMLQQLQQKIHQSPAILIVEESFECINLEVFHLGVRDYIKKPFTTREMNQVIDRALYEVRLAREREELNHDLITAETVRTTVVTLSHYLNNYLTALNGNLALLEESIQLKQSNPNLNQLIEESRSSAASIQAVIHGLEQATNVKLIAYNDTTPMINIQAALNKELESIAQKSRE